MKKSSLICLTTIGLFALQGLLQSCDSEDSPDILTHEISSINVAPSNVLKSVSYTHLTLPTKLEV